MSSPAVDTIELYESMISGTKGTLSENYIYAAIGESIPNGAIVLQAVITDSSYTQHNFNFPGIKDIQSGILPEFSLFAVVEYVKNNINTAAFVLVYEDKALAQEALEVVQKRLPAYKSTIYRENFIKMINVEDVTFSINETDKAYTVNIEFNTPKHTLNSFKQNLNDLETRNKYFRSTYSMLYQALDFSDLGWLIFN